ncbi:MAG: hypothetical protein IJA25_07925, partial [Anaerotignum sp.]|nr:hypothetical protein [Anaerotignum sp.]
MQKIIRTEMLDRYLIKLGIRVFIFATVFLGYLTQKEILYDFMAHEFTFGILEYGIRPLHVLWLIFMGMMFFHLFPHERLTMALRKEEKSQYVPVKDYSELELLRFVQDQNAKAWMVMLVWLCFNAIWGILYLLKVIDSADLLMLTVFYF